MNHYHKRKRLKALWREGVLDHLNGTCKISHSLVKGVCGAVTLRAEAGYVFAREQAALQKGPTAGRPLITALHRLTEKLILSTLHFSSDRSEPHKPFPATPRPISTLLVPLCARYHTLSDFVPRLGGRESG